MAELILNKMEEFRAYMEKHVNRYGSKKGLELETDREVIKYVKDKKIDSIKLWFTDILGNLKQFSITPNELEGALEEGMGFDGSSVEGYVRIHESDMVAVPVAKTAQLIPFPIGGSRAIRMFAKIQTPEGKLYMGDPRNILKKNLERLVDFNLTDMYLGPEAEYFYFKDDSSPTIIDSAGYFDLNPVDEGDCLREATVFALQSMGIQVEYHHHEVAPSQHEIDLKFKDAQRMADNLQTYKWLVKEVARKNGVHATFMPKPLVGENGSGMHVHLSLFKDKSNKFFDCNDQYHLSEMAKQFTAGILQHAPEICLATNQWVNSYKRLVPGFEAPTYIAWAEKNRSALVRIPVYKPGKEIATRIEARFPDPACNPYLAFSVLLGAGLNGVENKYQLQAPVTADLYKMPPEEREKLGIEQLPQDLRAAALQAKESKLMKSVLGEEVLSKLVEAKMEEDLEHRKHVSEKELRDYLKL